MCRTDGGGGSRAPAFCNARGHTSNCYDSLGGDRWDKILKTCVTYFLKGLLDDPEKHTSPSYPPISLENTVIELVSNCCS